MATSLTELTQTKSVALGSRHQPAQEPPPPPPAAILESHLTAAAKMRRPANQSGGDGFASTFAPWASSASAKPTTVTGTEPPVFIVPVAEAKVEELRTTIGIITGRVKATAKEHTDVALLFRAKDENDPLVRATRLRRTTGSSLSFGERARKSSAKVRESGAQVLLRVLPEGTDRAIELRVCVQRLGPEGGRNSSFIEVTGTAPLANRGEVQLIDRLREQLTYAWGRRH